MFVWLLSFDIPNRGQSNFLRVNFKGAPSSYWKSPLSFAGFEEVRDGNDVSVNLLSSEFELFAMKFWVDGEIRFSLRISEWTLPKTPGLPLLDRRSWAVQLELFSEEMVSVTLRLPWAASRPDRQTDWHLELHKNCLRLRIRRHLNEVSVNASEKKKHR